MAYQIWDGFDHYDAAHDVWQTGGAGGAITYSASYARFPAAPNCNGLGMRIAGSQLNAHKTFNLNSNQPTLIFGFAVYFESLPGSGWEGFLQLLDNGTGQCVLVVGANGAIGLQNGGSSGNGAAVIAVSAPGLVTAGRYYWLDVEITVNNTTGAVTVYLSTPAGGGSPILSASGLNTRQSANNYANQIIIGDLFNFISMRFDDFHCHDTTGSAPNAILGEGTRIYTKVPNGAGYATTLTPNGASANWQCVDDIPPDDDTTYVSAATFPSTEGYAVGAAGFTGTVNGVVRRSRIRKDDGAAHTFQNGVRSSTTNGLGTAVAVGSTYGWTDSFFAQDPNTSAAWTAGGADTAAPVISAAS